MDNGLLPAEPAPAPSCLAVALFSSALGPDSVGAGALAAMLSLSFVLRFIARHPAASKRVANLHRILADVIAAKIDTVAVVLVTWPEYGIF